MSTQSDMDSNEVEQNEPLGTYLPPGYSTDYPEMETASTPEPDRSGWISLTALRVTLGRIPLWLIAGSVPLILAIVGAMGWFGWFQSAISNHYEAGSQTAWLSDNFRTDHSAELGQLRAATGRMAAMMTFVMFLVGVFTAGGWLQVFLERTSGHSVDRFFHGGVRYFWRFLRVFICVLILLGVGNFLIYGDLWKQYILEGLFSVPDGDLNNLDSEKTARQLTWMRDGCFAFWFAMVMVWADYLRTRLSFHGSRSVIWSGLATFFMILLRPITTLRPMLGLLIVEAGVLLGAGYLSTSINRGMDEATGASSVWGLVAITSIMVLWRTVCHAARYHAAVQVTRVIVEPLGVDDPWENSVGGPGGPRYRVGEEDFEISI